MIRPPSRAHRLVASLLAVVALAVLSAAPASAAPSDFGAEALCRYQETAGDTYGWTSARLKRIAVRPPSIYAMSGTQKVGWRFVVRRSLDRENGPWTVTYRSPLQKRTATTATAADFDAMRVGVAVPTDVEFKDFVHYRVTLKLFWYRADGSVASDISYLFPQYQMYVDGVDEGSDSSYCPGEANRYHE